MVDSPSFHELEIFIAFAESEHLGRAAEALEYTASRNMTKSGISGNGALAPVLGVIDAHTLTWIGNIPTSINSHSVAADSTTGRVFVPIAATATTAGGIKVFGPVGSP